ncbi:MAG TPA: hypothetical protein VN669_06650 [Candidatus Acidoferrales bacterium]|nr:hypothetical protein [Candidatus Acidoferrales bacterium]
MKVWIRRAVWMLVIYGILHLLIAPLPELGASLSGKPLVAAIVLTTYALIELFLLIFLISFGPASPGFSCWIDVLDKICLRLC